MATDPTWDFSNPASKDRMLSVLRREIEGMFELASDRTRWEAPTACEHWGVRDVVGHIVDTTEGYLPAWGLARSGGTAPDALGVRGMAVRVDEHARAFRKVPQDEMLDRLRDDATKMLAEFDALTEADWTGLIVSHGYMGPLPASFYPLFQLVDYAVHSWDIREGRGAPHGLAGDSADLLVPLIYVLWSATADVSSVDRPFSVGIRVTGNNGGDVRADVSPEGVQIAPGRIEDCDAIIEMDPATLVLAGYGRLNGGTVRGDAALASEFRTLFFPI